MTALRGRDYRNLLAAGLISETGDWLLLVALPILVFEVTGSTFGTAIAFLIELAPPILLGTLAGRLADRWNRRRALIWLSVAVTGLYSTLQEAGRDRVGRVFGAVTTVFAAGQAVGMTVAGLLGDRVDLIALLNAQAGLYLLAGAVAAATLARRRDDPRRGRRGPPNESGSGGFEPNPLGGSGGMQPPSVNPGNTGKT